MPTVTQIRNKFQTKVFDKYGKSVSLKTPGTPVYDDYGDVVSEDLQSSSITVLPYDINQDVEELGRWGDVNFGDTFFAVPYTESPSVGDKITMEGDDWEIKDVKPHYLPDNLIWIVRCTKVVAQ